MQTNIHACVCVCTLTDTHVQKSAKENSENDVKRKVNFGKIILGKEQTNYR